MKRIFWGVLVAFVVFLSVACNDAYDDWQTISIEKVGTLKIPYDWKSYIEDKYLYIVDGNDTPMMIQSYSFYRSATDEAGIIESNKYADSFQCVKSIDSTCLSNSATYGKLHVLHNGEQNEKFFLDIDGYDFMQLIFWDSNIDGDMVKKIAESFEPYFSGNPEPTGKEKTGDGSLS